jgi:lipopolysaccharide transport protein LptA
MRILVSLFFIGFTISAWSQEYLPEIDTNMPITIDADSSEFDYATNRLLFRQLRLDQGSLGIEADLAETDKLDFTDGVWIFTDNVKIKTDTATLTCDSARLNFKNHQLVAAELTGSPANFEQFIPESGQTNSGEANSITYSLKTGGLQLRDNARFSDGANEISGDLITYDLLARKLTVGSGENGPVKIIIEPPSNLKEKVETR